MLKTLISLNILKLTSDKLLFGCVSVSLITEPTIYSKAHENVRNRFSRKTKIDALSLNNLNSLPALISNSVNCMRTNGTWVNGCVRVQG